MLLRALLSLLEFAAVTAAAGLGALYLLQDRLLFFPQPLASGRAVAIARRHPTARHLELTAADGTHQRAWLLPAGAAGQKHPLVIYFGGNAEETSYMLDEVAPAATCSWLLVSYRGYGGSHGKPGEAALYADALAWYDLAAARPDVDATRIVAFGRSLGSGVATWLATRRPLAGVVLVTPYDSMVAVGRRHYPYLPVGLLLRNRFDSLARAPHLHVPALFLPAAHDHIVPPAHARRLYEAWAGPRIWRLLPRVGHNDIQASPDYWPTVRDFLSQVGGPG